MKSTKRMAFESLLKGMPETIGFHDFVSTLYAFSWANMPTRLYRYRECGRAHSFDDVEKHQITFSSPESFEDKSDSTIHDTGLMDRMAELIMHDRESTITKLNDMLKGARGAKSGEMAQKLPPLAEAFYANSEKEQKRSIEKAKEKVRQTCNAESFSEMLRKAKKIVCLCENGNSQYMWEHYAGNGTGFMVEYQVHDLVKLGNKYRHTPLILPVVYLDSLPDTFIYPFLMAYSDIIEEIFGEDICNGAIALEEIKSVFCKHRDPYEAEEEWRMMIAAIESEWEDERIFRSIKPTRLVAGRAMNPSDRDRLYQCAESAGILIHDQDVSIWEMIEK